MGKRRQSKTSVGKYKATKLKSGTNRTNARNIDASLSSRPYRYEESTIAFRSLTGAFL